jgi:hypothetical protein
VTNIEDRYRTICKDFDALVTHSIAISSAIAGKDAERNEHLYAAAIFKKLVGHAVTLRRISPTGMQPEVPGVSELWDLSSASSLARAVVETYDALAYVAVHQANAEERHFRILLWKLHDQERRQKILGLIGSSSSNVAEIGANVSRLRDELLAHPLFICAEKSFVGNVKSRKTPSFHLSQLERNEQSGVNHDYYNAAVMFLSSHVHTFPFAVHQLMQFRAGELDSLRMMSMPMQYATGFLAKGIQGMSEIFAEDAPMPSQSTRDTLDMWLGIVKDGVKDVLT